jgi:hypothetical protein
MLRRIRELQAAGPALGHVTEQHLISKVLLKRFAEPSGPRRGLICPFRLEYPPARHRLVGADGCAKVNNFVAWASASVERLWKETEDRLPDALAAMDPGTLFSNAGHVSVTGFTGLRRGQQSQRQRPSRLRPRPAAFRRARPTAGCGPREPASANGRSHGHSSMLFRVGP